MNNLLIKKSFMVLVYKAALIHKLHEFGHRVLLSDYYFGDAENWIFTHVHSAYYGDYCIC